MSENPDFPYEGDPARAEESHDLTPDFFDDVAEPSPVSSGPIEEPLHAETGEHPHGPHSTSHVPEVELPPGAPVFPVVMGILMVGVIVVSILVANMEKGKETAAPAAPAAAAPEAPAPADLLAGDVKSLKEEFEKLTGQIKDLSAKVDGLPKPPPPPDLKPIQAKIDALTRSVASVEGVGGKLDKIDAQVKSLGDGVKSATDKVSALSADVQKATASAAKAQADAAKAISAATAPKPAPAATTTPTPTPASTSTSPKPEEDATATVLAQGADLFKAGKYKEADDLFKKLAGSSPKDARVYYYAALTNGLTTNDWQNETVKIATQGAELEKTGVTKPADIDSAFSGLPDNLKPWLDYFRKLGK